MQIKDARSLPSVAQEDLRYKVVTAVAKGMTQTKAAEVFNVSRYSVFKWTKAHSNGGKVALRSRMRGRPAVSKLKGYEAASIVRIITDSCPEQVKLPFVLWTREAVQMLIARRCGLQLSIWTVGRYLVRWGFTPQKPARRAYEKDNAEVNKWLKEEYPAIKKRAGKLKAEIHWEDETGMRSDHQAGTTWAPRGQTPVVSCTGKRFRTNMISSITNRGNLAFRIYRCKFTAELFIDFIKRLIKHKRQKVFVIVDGHPVHKSQAVKDWLSENSTRIEMFRMPGYSPELNPDELLNQDVKTNAVGRQRAKTLDELEGNIEQYLIQRQVFPEIVQKYFQKASVVYAA
jgi:transposase